MDQTVQKPRDYFFDNLKFWVVGVLIFMGHVSVDHSIENVSLPEFLRLPRKTKATQSG